ncbi:MAG: hypothetical protein JWM11_3513 [Planctomycetaceae bacterium]|nr:hypothetical protein [Planctomycetaceae bacterium]
MTRQFNSNASKFASAGVRNPMLQRKFVWMSYFNFTTRKKQPDVLAVGTLIVSLCVVFGLCLPKWQDQAAAAEKQTSAAVAVADKQTSDSPPSFRRDVMPIFFRAGCNSGTCHGSARGKDGFLLSLFGFNPKGDYERVTNEIVGRRVNTAVPEQSLLLLKAIGAVPHTGGKLFDRDSDYYRTLLRWITAGAPDDAASIPETLELSLSKDRLVFEQAGAMESLRAVARASDGSKRDVTALARYLTNDSSVATIDSNGQVKAVGPGDTYVFARFNRFTIGTEVIVLPSATGFTWPNPPVNNYIDELVFDRLQKLRIAPSELCDDESFLRRLMLDLVGRPPTVEEYQAFMAAPNSDKQSKRAAKIDELLATDAFADVWTAIWAEQLRVMGGNYAPDATHLKAADAYFTWIRQQMRSGRPLNEFVADMVASSGSNLTNGPANLYTMLVHRPRFEPKVFASDFSQLFLGVQIQCAECHNHPFDRWTMDDYYGLVSFFTGVRRKNGAESREWLIYADPAASPARHLIDDRPMPAKVLGGESPVESSSDPRRALAQWLTSPDNKMFSRNLANRIWAHFLGRGIIEPVDDVRVSNPPVNGPLLTALSEHLVKSGFNLRALVRDICNSRVYQLSISPNASNARDTRQFSHARLRRLRSDILLDSIVAVTDSPRNFDGFPAGTKAVEYYPRSSGGTEGPNFGDAFFATFGRSSRATICACETKREPTLSQALHLVAGDTLRDRLASGGVVQKLVETKATPEEIIDGLFIRVLSRHPTTGELTATRALVGEAIKDQAAYEDIFWSLLNSTEFGFNH